MTETESTDQADNSDDQQLDQRVGSNSDLTADTADDQRDDRDGEDRRDGDYHGDYTPSGREAGYRRRLRETEAERDRLAEQNTTLRRAMAEQLITAEGVKPQAVWAVTELPELCDDDGLPDRDKVKAAVQAARETLGVQPATGLYVPAEGRVPTPPTLPADRNGTTLFTPTGIRLNGAEH